jgi:hypothetical protein
MGNFEMSAETTAEQFIRAWLRFFFLLSLLVACFTCTMDPYLLVGTPRIPGFNARKPAADTQQALMKAYDVFRVKPKTLILGSSRAALGLDGLDPVWPQEHRPVYNLALPLAGPDVAYGYLIHALVGGCPISLVVLTTEFEYWIDFDNYAKDELARHISATSSGRGQKLPTRVVLHDFFMAIFSLTALEDGIKTLTAYLRNDPEDLVAGNWTDSWWAQAERFKSIPYSSFMRSDVGFVKFFSKKTLTSKPTVALRAIADLCRQRNIRLIVILSPSHAEESEMLDWLGYSAAIERWKRELVELTANYGAELWDFDDYNSFTMEPVPMSKRPMQWFFDPEHYSREMGHEILNRIFDGGDPVLGTRLSSLSIERHLRERRQHQHEFEQGHKLEIQTMRAIYESTARSGNW